jgi:hypothetical protein
VTVQRWAYGRYGNLAGGQGRIKRLLAKKNTFQGTINGVAGVWQGPNLSMDENLATNLMYGAAVCRLCYYRKPDALPEAGDIEGQAASGSSTTTHL